MALKLAWGSKDPTKPAPVAVTATARARARARAIATATAIAIATAVALFRVQQQHSSTAGAGECYINPRRWKGRRKTFLVDFFLLQIRSARIYERPESGVRMWG